MGNQIVHLLELQNKSRTCFVFVLTGRLMRRNDYPKLHQSNYFVILHINRNNIF